MVGRKDECRRLLPFGRLCKKIVSAFDELPIDETKKKPPEAAFLCLPEQLRGTDAAADFESGIESGGAKRNHRQFVFPEKRPRFLIERNRSYQTLDLFLFDAALQTVKIRK